MSPGPCRLVACLSRGPACSRPLRAHARRAYWTVECTAPSPSLTRRETLRRSRATAPPTDVMGIMYLMQTGLERPNADGAGAADATVSLPLPSRARGVGAL